MAGPSRHHELSKGQVDTLTELSAHWSGDAAILESHVEKADYELSAGDQIEKLADKYDHTLFSRGMSEVAKQREGLMLLWKRSLSFWMRWTQLKRCWKSKRCML